MAGATFTDSFLASSFFFFGSDGVASFFGEGFGVAFAAAVFFGVDLGVGFAVGITRSLGRGVGVTIRFGEGGAGGVGEWVGVDSGMSLRADIWVEGSVDSSGADGEVCGGGTASVRDGELIAATSPLIQTMFCKLAFRVSRFQRTSPIMIAM